MPSLTLLLCCCLALSGGVWSLKLIEASTPQEQQRFILDLLLQVHRPLLQHELIELGSQLNTESSQYQEDSFSLLVDFLALASQNRILGPYSVYSQLAPELPQQLLGVYRFLVLAKDWRTFQQNACYARRNFNAVLFVNALQLALRDRPDTQELLLPAMEEVLPQLYFGREVIMEAQQISWHQLAVAVTPRLSWRQLLVRLASTKSAWHRRPPSTWRFELTSDEPIVIGVPTEARLSRDGAANSYWNDVINRQLLVVEEIAEQRRRNLNDYAIIDGDRMMAFRGPQDEIVYREELQRGRVSNNRGNAGQLFMRELMQLVARLQLEDLANNEEDALSAHPQQLTTGGLPYKSSKLSEDAVLELVEAAVAPLRVEIEAELRRHRSESRVIVAEHLEARFGQLCQQLSSKINGESVEAPTMLGMATSHLRDPVYRKLLLKLAEIITDYAPEQLVESGSEQLQLINIEVGALQTYEELADTDLLNLIDQQLLQTQSSNLPQLRRRIVARQRRLSHRPFSISCEVVAQRAGQVLVRSYLLGKATAPLLLDSFISQLRTGFNLLERHSRDIQWTSLETPTLSELYEGAEPMARSRLGSWPQRLLLPRGTVEGLPLQLLVRVTPWSGKSKLEDVWWNSPRGGASALRDVVIEHETIKH